MNDLQKCELEILKEFDRICKKNNLSYSLNSGTMLGAIRHKGFIPWDDDIDVMMPAKDYKKLCKIAPKQLDSKFFLQTSYTDNWYASIAKIRMNGTTAIEEGFEKYRFHQGVWIDIFPITGVGNNDSYLKLVNKLLLARNILLKDAVYKEQYKEYPQILKKIKLIMLIPLCIRRILCRILDCIILRDHKNKEYFCYLLVGGKIFRRFKTEYIKDYIPMQFEDGYFPVAVEYDEMLEKTYGDYMTLPPVEKRNGGDHILSIVDLNNDYRKYLK